jgi:hypothetical protein
MRVSPVRSQTLAADEQQAFVRELDALSLADSKQQPCGSAAFAAVATPGPPRTFHQRVRSRRGPQIAIIAVARKLAVLFWHLLTRGEDYAYGRPSLTEHKPRQIELLAGAEHRRGQRGRTTSYRNVEVRDRERDLQRLEARLPAHDPDDLAIDHEAAARAVFQRRGDLG